MSATKNISRLAQFTPDDRQREAIEHVHGPMLVVAGAGTGKTSVLTNRIARLVEGGHARPDEILALTYTRNAVAEMKERVSALLGGKQVQVATFHDYCLKLLQNAGKDFGVLDDSDLWIYLRRRMRELHLEYFVRAANVSEFLRDLLGFISRCHDELITPEKYAQYVAKLERGELRIPRVTKSTQDISDQEVLGRCREIARVFEMTERWLKEENLGTFSHMITGARALLDSDPAAREAAATRAKFILVDEFQDTNFSQVKILSTLAGPQGNIFAVGDPDQAIYRFRGASSAAFELFYRQFPAAKRVILGINRRSRSPILNCAFALIKENPPVFDRHPAHGAYPIDYQRTALQSARDQAPSLTQMPAAPVEAITFATQEAESSDIVSTIKTLRCKLRCKWSDFGVLYRQHFNRDKVVRDLADAGIPFLIESMDVSDTPEIRDLFACLSVVLADGDDVSLFRVAALPQFQLDPAALRAKTRALAKSAREGRIAPLASVLSDLEGGPEIRAAIASARETISRRQAKGRAALEIIACQFQLDTSSRILQAALNFVENWEKKKINQSTELSEFVEYLALFRQFPGAVIPLLADENEDAVRLMTVHLAKGLEFPHVFILRASSGSFPLYYRETLVEFPNELRDPDSAAEGDPKELTEQEERRLFYVAMTRARDSLRIYAAQGRGKKDPTPPGFLRKLMGDKSLSNSLACRQATGTPLDIFAAASSAYPGPSRLAGWLDLQATEGLHAQLSASAVDTYERCPLQFKLERDWRLSARPAAAMQYGAAMHRVLKTYFDALREGRPRTEELLITQFRDDLAGAGIQDPYQHELYEKQGIAQLKDFFAAAQRSTPPEVLHTEERFDILVGETKVIGRIDRIDRASDGSVVVVDYKTGRSRDQEDADESLQLSLYALAAKQKWGYDVHSLVFYNLEENVPVATGRDESALREACDRVATAAKSIAAGEFQPNPKFHCTFCSYRTVCPAKEEYVPNLSKPPS